MRRRSEGQSLVEMALMLPLLLMILFGIIDLGYYIYGYSTIYEAARNGTEKAANLAPYKSSLTNSSEDCMAAILAETQKGVVLFSDFSSSNVQISYPSGTRALGQPVQVEITYNIQPLTPLFRFVSFGSQGVLPIHVMARRSIENMGSGPPSPDHPNGIVCSGND
jgi:hypothetical protein